MKAKGELETDIVEAAINFVHRSRSFAGGGFCVRPEDFEELETAVLACEKGGKHESNNAANRASNRCRRKG